MGTEMSLFFDTFNLYTVSSSLFVGFGLGLFAFMPLIRQLAPSDQIQEGTAKELFLTTFIVTFIATGVIVCAFFISQILPEVITAVDTAWQRAIGRWASMLLFVLAFSFGLGLEVYREAKKGEIHLEP